MGKFLLCRDIADNDMLEFGALQFTVYTTPGHTVGHVVYLLEGSPFSAPPCLFSGDHIFLAGAGQYVDMLLSLYKLYGIIVLRIYTTRYKVASSLVIL